MEPVGRHNVTVLLLAMRPHQWVKNLLVLVPLLAAHKLSDASAWAYGLLTLGVFSVCASGVYVLNDVLDVDLDRQHPRKRARAFAAGALSRRTGVAITVVLVAIAGLLAAVVSPGVAGVVAIYVVVTTAYSLKLKYVPVTDVFTLTAGYVLRIVAGGVATSTPLSTWLLAFALFFFLSLAFVKRYAELVTLRNDLRGRGYGAGDAMWMHAIGTSAGYMAVLVLALYVSARDVALLYSRPDALWALCPLLLFWITRLWFRTGRNLVHDDPVVEAFKDPVSYLVALLSAAILVAAI